MTASTHDEATEQARALGDPTRNAIFRYVDAASDPVGVAELTDHFGLNHNAIRQHLAKLRDAGLVVEELATPSGPGRPRAPLPTEPRCGGTLGEPQPIRAAVLTAHRAVADRRRPANRRPRHGPSTGEGGARRHRSRAPPRDAHAAARLRTPHCRTAGRRRGGARPVPVRRNRDGGAGDRLRAPSRVGRGRGRVRTRGARVRDLVVRPAKRAGCRIVIDVD